ncbi:MAG: hypothetical protein A4E72_00165 [Syntrophus sp. PtaU1.Bin208]|nr:MAG: hypothetical protein A4E72_00165 [Syntrophus sp. PtaU1.Bin208]
MIFRKINSIFFAVLMAVLILAGCGSGKATAVLKDSNREDVHRIAVLPVFNETSDQQAALLLRDKIQKALYFKGYPKITAQFVDEQLGNGQTKEQDTQDKAEYFRALGKQMQVDAILYCDLRESRTNYYLLYAPLSVSAVFELRSAKSGQLLWRNSYSAIKRNYGLSKNSLRLKGAQDYEDAIQELVDQAMKGIPDSSDVLG